MKSTTIIRATHRTQDLIPALLAALREYNPARYMGHMVSPFGPVPAYAMEDDDSSWWDSEDAHYLLECLFDDLNDTAPDGYYFGAHPGDGSDFGFWPIDDSL